MAKPRKRAERLTRLDVIGLIIFLVISLLVTSVVIARDAGVAGLGSFGVCALALSKVVIAAINR